MLLSHQPWRYRYLLLLLRTLSLLGLIFLLLNPLVYSKRNEINPQKISVIFDLSESMFSHMSNYQLQYDEIQKKIKKWGDKYDLNLDFFQLGGKISKLEIIKDADLTTDFRDLPDFISFMQPQQVLLITDGKVTEGKNINEIEFNRYHPIHTVGVGPIHTDQNIEIQDVILPDILTRGDSINLKIRIHSRINEDTKSDFQIMNVSDNHIYNERILFEKGNQIKYLTIKVPADILNGVNMASISPLKGEVQIDNNTFSFSGNLKDSVDQILLISGALSQNSRMIEGLLDEIENTNTHHSFRMNQKEWNEEPLKREYSNLKMIVLDDFPIYKEDRQLFQDIIALSKSQHLPICYMQGPWGNLTSGEIIRNSYPHFVPKVEDSDALMNISTQSSWLETSIIDLNQIPPQSRSIKWTQSEQPWISYMDGSVLIGNKNSFYLVSIPALVESHLKINRNSKSIIALILKKVFLHAFYGNEGLVSLEIDGNYFYKGEEAQLFIAPAIGIDLKDFSGYAVTGADTLHLDCNNAVLDKGIRCSTVLLIPGEYMFYAEASLPSNKKVYSNTKSVIVQNVKVELIELIQDRQALMDISYQTGGIYASIDSLDSMLANIDITPVQRIKNYQISGLSSQNYWWIVIFLLSIEWYFRKKLGLL